MRKQDIGTLALRLGALYCLLQSLPYLGSALNYLTWPGMPVQTLAMPAIGAVLMIFAARVLQSYARPWGRRLAGPDPEAVIAERWTAGQVQAIAFCAVGAYLVAEHAPALVAWAGQTLAMAAIADKARPRALDPAPWHSMGEQMIGMALGLWLFLGLTGWIGVWHRVHKFGSPGN